MGYADYRFYMENYHGTSIHEEQWPVLSERASDYLDYITQGRVSKNSELPQVKKAVCALAENYGAMEKAKAATATENGELASQTVQSWSVTYRSGMDTARQYESQLYTVAQQYLSNTGLMSRGRGCHRCICPTL